MSICAVGSINLDHVARVQAAPAAGETVLASSLSRAAGGKGLNQAVAAARAGAQVAMVGRVGCDEPADWLLGVLAGAGVDTAQVARDPTQPTGQAFITVSQAGENCIVVAAGANSALQSVPVQAARGARVLLVQLETALEPVEALLAADLPGCLKLLNAAPALAAGAPMFAHCDVLILNQTELALYAGLPAAPAETADIVRAARRLLCRSEQSLIVTLGAQGALVVDASQALHLPGQPARVVDTVGAGDCFCGVLAAGLDAGLNLPAAAARANMAAALAVSRPGGADAMPTRAEIDAAT